MLKLVAFLCISLLTLSAAKADLIIQPLTPTSTVAASAGSSLAGLVNGTGLSATLTTGTDVSTALTTTQANNVIADCYVTVNSGSDYFAAGTAPVLTFSLGGTFDDINSILLWNYPQGTGTGGVAQNNSLRTFSLQFYSDTGATNQVGSTLTGLTVGRALPVTGTGSGPQTAQQIFFPGGIDYDGIAAIKMTLTDNYFGVSGGAGGDRVGFGEVRFAQAIPEPASLSCLLLLAGAGISAWAASKRRA